MDEKIIVCDFDGTITQKDTIGDFLEKYADKEWLEIESDWLGGKINSQQCMQRQFELVKGITDEELNKFLAEVRIDESFVPFYNSAKKNGIKVVIVSDGFDLFIKSVLNRYGVTDIEIFTNHLEFIDGRFYMSFPNKNSQCKKQAGTCKCSLVQSYKNIYKKVFYVGDSVSDFCVSDKADYLFAKHKLLHYCKEKNLSFIEYNTFEEVIKYDRLGLII